MNDYNDAGGKVQEATKKWTLMQAHGELLERFNELIELKKKSEKLYNSFLRRSDPNDSQTENIVDDPNQYDIVELFMIISDNMKTEIKQITDNIENVEDMIE